LQNPDLFFLSYSESNAEENWQHLRQRFPQAKRLHGIQGVYRAHALLAQVAETDFYFVIDGDNQIHDNFRFEVEFEPRFDSLYVWRAQNPINDLIYGFGAVKLYNKKLFANKNISGADVATTIAPRYVPVSTLASTTFFNATPLEAWRGAFRECAKLTANIYKNPEDHHSCERLKTWLSIGEQRPRGHWCLSGAKQGHDFALNRLKNSLGLEPINDFVWLNNEFLKNQQISTDSISNLEL
jgi:hypothetical protein